MLRRTVALLLAAIAIVPLSANLLSAGSAFPESRLITPAHGAQLNGWANQAVDQKWELCYNSHTMNKTTTEFHRRCDEFKPTVTVARNSGGAAGRGVCNTCPDGCGQDGQCGSDSSTGPCKGPGGGRCSDSQGKVPSNCWPIGEPCGETNPGNFTFGGFADATWEADKQDGPKGSAATFLFGLGPGKPERYGPTAATCANPNDKTKDQLLECIWNPHCNNTNMCHGAPDGLDCPNLRKNDCSCCQCSNINDCEKTFHQVVRSDLWPTWGYDGMGNHDLAMGSLDGGGPPGHLAFCKHGATYATPDSEKWCGGDDWGETDLEIWRLSA